MPKKITLNTDGLKRMREHLAYRRGEIRTAFLEWGAIYGRFILARFLRFSKGGGNWRRLAESTLIARRRRGNFSTLILQDRGLILKELQKPTTLSAIGVRSKTTEFGLVVDYTSEAVYEDSGVNVSDVMSYHNTGGPNLPKRQIHVQPSREVKREMAKVMKKAILKTYRNG